MSLLERFSILCAATLAVAINGSVFAQEPASAAGKPGDGQRPKTVLDFGAVGDAKTDDTAAIQRAVDSRVGDVQLPRGVYRISRPIVIELDKVGPTSIYGTGTPRIVMTGAGPAFHFIGTHEGTADPGTVKPEVWQRQRMPTVDGIEIVGAHPEACGIEATGTMQIVITRVNIRETVHAIHLTKRNRNVIVANCHLYQNRGAGLFLDDVNLHQTNVSACHISYCGAGGIVARAGNIRNIQISGCDIEGNMDPKGPPTANVLIDGTDGTYSTAEVAISGCTIQHAHDAPDSANIRFIGTDQQDRRWGHLTIADNVLSDVQINIDIQKARSVCITGNTCWKGVQHDLRVVDSSNVVVGPNVFDRNPQYQDQATADGGIVMRDCRDCTLTGLHVNGVRRAPAGLLLENCRRMNLSGCTLLDCDHAGIILRNVTDSQVSWCLLRNDLPDAGKWDSLVVEGGSGNRIDPGLPGVVLRPLPESPQ